MNIILGIFGIYVAYFVGMMIYDAFIAKPIKAVKVGTDETDTDLISLEDHEMPLQDEVQNVTFDSMQGSNSASLDLDSVADRSESEVLTETQNRSEQEEYINNEPVQPEVENQSSFNQEAENKNSFIMEFAKLQKGTNETVRSVERLEQDIDLVNFINSSTKVSSFSFSKHKMMA